MRVVFEGEASDRLSRDLALSLRRECAALLSQLNELERRLDGVRNQIAALDGATPMLDLLRGLLHEKSGKIQASEIWAAVGKPIARYRKQKDNTELGRAMRRLGWVRCAQRFGGSPRSAYAKGTAAERRRPLFLVKCPATGGWEAVGVNDVLDEDRS